MLDIKNANMIAGTALETMRTKGKFIARGWMYAGAAGLTPLVLLTFIWLILVSPMTFSVVSNHYVSSDAPITWRVKDSAGKPHRIQVQDVNGATQTKLTSDEYSEAISSFVSENYWINPVWTINAILFLALGLFWPITSRAHKLFFALGQKTITNKRLKGALDVVTAAELDKQVREDGGGDWTICDVAFPNNAFKYGTGISGQQRSGKSLVMHDLIKQASSKNVRLFIHDPQAEFYEANFRPGIDCFFNPAMVGSIPWSIFLELLTENDARELAQAAIPVTANAGANAFFDDAARSLLSALIISLAKRGVTDSSELARAFFSATHEELVEYVKGTNAAFLVSDNAKGMTDSIKASAGIYLNGILSIEPGTWTLRDFLAQPEGNLYILGDDSELSPVKRMLVMALTATISKAGIKTHEPKYLFLLDEYQLLGDCKVDKMLSALAKFGVAVVVGMQNESQLANVMGESRAAATLSLFGNYLQLKINGKDAQDKASGRFGMQLQEVVSTSQQLSVTEARDSIGISKAQQDKPIIMGTEFGMLPPLTGYLKLSGDARTYPAAKVDYMSWLKKDSEGHSFADELQFQVAELPAADSRFDIVRQVGDDYKRNLAINILGQQIVRLELRQSNLTQAKAIDAIKAQIFRKKEAMQELIDGGEIIESEQDDEIEIEPETLQINENKTSEPEWGVI